MISLGIDKAVAGVMKDGAFVKSSKTYIWVRADGLENILVKVTRVTHQGAADVVGVLQPLEDGIYERSLGALAKLRLLGLNAEVKVLDPRVVLGRQSVRDMLLEDHDVGVWDVDAIVGGKQRSGLVVERSSLEDW